MGGLINPLKNIRNPSGSLASNRRLEVGEYDQILKGLSKSSNHYAAVVFVLGVETTLREATVQPSMGMDRPYYPPSSFSRDHTCHVKQRCPISSSAVFKGDHSLGNGMPTKGCCNTGKAVERPGATDNAKRSQAYLESLCIARTIHLFLLCIPTPRFGMSDVTCRVTEGVTGCDIQFDSQIMSLPASVDGRFGRLLPVAAGSFRPKIGRRQPAQFSSGQVRSGQFNGEARRTVDC
jgi:hypothetical protein